MAQLEFYLIQLSEKGIVRDGRLELIEKNKTNNKIHYIKFSDIRIEELKAEYKDIEEFLESTSPPHAVYSSKCKNCAYYEYCFI